MQEESVYDTVNRLNEKLWFGPANDKNLHHGFLYTSGYVFEAIQLTLNFDNYSVTIDMWNSENEDRVWVEKRQCYKPLYEHLITKYGVIIKDLTKLKSDLKA